MKQSEALDILKMGKNVFLTGPAGSGKTYVLNQYIDYLKKNRVAIGITASTGIAATHIGGVTIHSWCGLGIKTTLTEKDIKDITKKSYLKKRVNAAQVLIIDEVSMLSADQFDAIEALCRSFRKKDEPFGGLQVVLSGDFFQLPPISRNDEKADFIYISDAWKHMGLAVCYLDEQYRHEDAELTTILNDIRADRTGEHTRVVLRTCYKRAFADVHEPTKLYTHNADVDRINHEALTKIEGKERSFYMDTTGPQKLIEALVKSCLAPEELILKQNAIVMFVKNNIEGKYVNGTLGRVIDFNDGLPVVETYQGEEVIAFPEKWAIEEEGEVKAHIRQVPLRLAWAITIHKSQGMSLDAAEMDLSKSFEPGMGYVALSRVRSITGLRLMGLNDVALQANESVRKIDEELQNISHEAVEELRAIPARDVQKAQKYFIERVGKTDTTDTKKEKKSTLDTTRELLKKGKTLEYIADKRSLTVETIIKHLEKLKERDSLPDIDYLKPETKLINIVSRQLKEDLDMKLSQLRARVGREHSYNDIRMARLFVD